jgi:hypothetical protein
MTDWQLDPVCCCNRYTVALVSLLCIEHTADLRTFICYILCLQQEELRLETKKDQDVTVTVSSGL